MVKNPRLLEINTRIWIKKFGTDVNASAEELTTYVRYLLREKFTTADVGITGANFIIADTKLK